MMPNQRFALGIEYDGQRYCGWQKQHHDLGVQECVEKALEQICAHPVDVVCAGRTDAGVHAIQQVIHFDSPVQRPDRAWTLGVNTHLPHDVAVRWVREVPQDFSARFSAVSRRYRYIIDNGGLKPALLARGVTHIYHPLDEEKMHSAGQLLLGEHDFSSFRAAQCQSRSPFRYIHDLRVWRQNRYVILDIQANAFVHHMVRNIAGALIVIGQGEQSQDWLQRVLEAKDRRLSAATAPALGLYLLAVEYPEQYQIPQVEQGPLFLISV